MNRCSSRTGNFGFKDRIGLLSKARKEKGNSPWTYLGMVDEPLVIERLARIAQEKSNDPDPV